MFPEIAFTVKRCKGVISTENESKGIARRKITIKW